MKKTALFFFALAVLTKVTAQTPKTDAALNTQGTVIKNETSINANTPLRVGTWMLDENASKVNISSYAGVTATGTDAYIACPTLAIISYPAFYSIKVTTTNANTGPATLSLCSLAAKNIKKIVSGALVSLVANDLCAGCSYWLMYNGTDFQILGGGSSGGGGGSGVWGAITGTLSDQSDLQVALNNKQFILIPTGVKTTTYSAVANDFIPVDATGGSVTINLPNLSSTSSNGVAIGVKLINVGSGNNVTIQTAGAAVFNKVGGPGTFTLTNLNGTAYFQFKCTGAFCVNPIWYSISENAVTGIVNTAAANEIPKSDATNIGPSGLYSLTAGNLDLGTTSLTGDRTISAKSSSTNNSLYFQTTNGSSTATNALQLFISGTKTVVVAPPGNLSLNGSFYGGRSLIGSPFGFDFTNFPTGLSETVVSNINAPSTVLLPFRIAANASAGTPANGFGVGMGFAAQNSAGTNVVGSQIHSVFNNVTPGSESTNLVISNIVGGVMTENIRISSQGGIGLSGSNFGTSGQVLTSGGVGGAASWTTVAGGGGTVSTVSVVSANGLAGTVANPTTTPAMTLSTTVNGLAKGNGTSFSAAVAGTDYQAPITLNPINYLPVGVTLSGSTNQQRCDAWQAVIVAAQVGGYDIRFSGIWDLPTDSIIVTDKLSISGIGYGSALTTTSNSGTLLTINAPIPRDYYKVVFAGVKPFNANNFILQYVGGSNPTVTSRGIKISVASTISFLNKLTNITIEGFYTGVEFHNVANSNISECYFRNNIAYGFLNTNNESEDYGKLMIQNNVFATSGILAGSPDSTAHIKIEGGSGFDISFNDFYGNTNYAVWTYLRNTTEFYATTASTEYYFKDNKALFLLDYAFLFMSNYGTGGPGTTGNAFAPNKIQNVQLLGNNTGYNGLVKTRGGVGSMYDFNILNNFNEQSYAGISHNVFVNPVNIDGNAITNFVVNSNTFVGTPLSVATLAQKPISVTGTITGKLNALGNTYTNYTVTSDIQGMQQDNLGIGRTPAVSLDVTGTGNIYGRFTRSSNSFDNGIIFTPNGALSSSNPQFFLGIPSSQSYFTIQRYDGTTASNVFNLSATTNNIGLGVAVPTATLHLKAGTATAGTVPLKFTSGVSLTAPEAGATEFTTDDLFFTITTGTARKRILMADPSGGLTSGRVALVTTNGRVTDDTGLTYASSNLTVGAGNNIVGVATNNLATAGNIGEEINAIQSTYTNYTTTGTYQNITSITLTAGDWDISAMVTYNSNSATITAAANAIYTISTTTASAAGAVEGQSIGYIPQAALLGTSKFTDVLAPYRVSLSGTTTYYLNTQAAFSVGNPQFVGSIRARRIR